jgi:ABC-type multidrug transport system fused ATPase/permease subunit
MARESIFANSNFTIFSKSLEALSQKDQKRVIATTLIQVFLNFLDLIGIAIIGLIGSLAVRGVQSEEPTERINSILRFLRLDGMSFQAQTSILGIFAVCLMVGKTLLSIYLSKKTIFFLSRRSAFLSASLISKMLSQSLLTIQKKSTQEHLYALTQGVSAMTIGVIGVTVLLIADMTLMTLIFVGLLFYDSVIALFTLLLFAVVGLLLYRLMHKRVHDLGEFEAKLNIKSSEKIIEVLSAYRESVVRNRRAFYAKEIGDIRLTLSNTLAELSLMPNISKYIVESTLLVASVIFCAIQFAFNDAVSAVSAIGVFVAASSRLAPAALRTQQGAIQIRRSIGAARATLSLIEALKDVKESTEEVNIPRFEHIGFSPNIEFRGVSFSYSQNLEKTINEISFNLFAGQIVAIVGASGAGKTTLVDLLLGVLKPDHGEIFISENAPFETVNKWEGAIAYVPQDVLIINGSVRENVMMGYPKSDKFDRHIWELLRVVGLEKLIRSKSEGLDYPVGDKGNSLSGGQRQRLGIARSLFTNPLILVLDESTSSLDGRTEQYIMKALQEFMKQGIIIIVAHRLGSIKNANHIMYLENGNLQDSGNYEELRKRNNNFAEILKALSVNDQ